eukprot:7929529-Ditylum_brightwellii.AAC.1
MCNKKDNALKKISALNMWYRAAHLTLTMAAAAPLHSGTYRLHVPKITPGAAIKICNRFENLEQLLTL